MRVLIGGKVHVVAVGTVFLLAVMGVRAQPPEAASAAPAASKSAAASADIPRVLFEDDGRVIRYFPAHVPGTAPAVTVFAGQTTEIPSFGVPGAGDASLRPARRTSNLVYHNGPVILAAKEISLFWGSAFDSDYASHVASFFGQFGTSGEYQTITQYYNGANQKIQLSTLGGVNRTDATTPPSTVSDSAAQQQIIANFQNGNLGTPNADTVYFLYLPNGVTSTSGGASSCTTYCGYHSNFTYNGVNVKYAVMPYPSCGGCQGNAMSGQSIAAASTTIVSGHEMREAATDPDGNAWYDRSGNEADDKCAWQLFVDGSYQYQKEWSNSTGSCVMKGVSGP